MGARLYNEIPGYRKGGWREMPEIIHNDSEIKGFFGEYRWLSNFGEAKVLLDGVVYPSAEIAYQAAKWAPEDRDFFNNCKNEESITYNRQYSPNRYKPEEWDGIKIDVMTFLLEQKFDSALNLKNYKMLMETGDRYLEETNWWNDTFWGKNLAGEGKNNLGELIMEIRKNLVHSSSVRRLHEGQTFMQEERRKT